MNITTIIFDLGDVYLRGFMGCEPFLGSELNIPADKIRKLLREDNALINLFEGKISEEEYWDNIIKKNNWNINKSILMDLTRNYFTEIEGTREIIESLKRSGFKLGLLSVHTKEWIDYCEKKFDYHKLFNSTCYSFEIGIRKPDKRAYKKILEKLQVKSTECLFIDDKIKNIKAAEELEITGILFKDAAQLKVDLKNLSIL